MEYSDHELAYYLQLEEAIAASLSLHPSPPFASTSTSTSFSVAPSSHVNVLEALEGNRGGVYYRPVVVRDKLENDRRDRGPREVEATRVMRDFSRMIHDQTSDNSGSQMPIVKSVEFIDMPYAEASSSSGALPLSPDETYRLYFKGLLRNGIVGGSKVSLCGIGVAICDSRDNLIFELKEPVRGIENRAVADLKALLEGLTTAFSLGIKRLKFFCDDSTVFYYSKRRWYPRKHNLATLVDKVIGVQRKFVYCHPNRLQRDKINYAVKLGRNAIASELDNPEQSNSDSVLKETCVICFEETNMDQMFRVSRCFHSYCFSCMKRHVEAKLLHGIMPKCPHEKCTSELKIKSCKKFSTPKIIEMMEQRRREASILPTNKVYCPFPRCSELMSKRQASIYAKKEGVQFKNSGERKCIKCHGFFCINCKTPWHNEMSCTEYKRLNPRPDEDTKLKSLASRELWRQCGKCKQMIELTEGCYHMTCRCGYEFCYTCGAKFKNAGKMMQQTCSCPLFDDDDDDDDDDDEDYETYSDDDYDTYSDGAYED